MFREEENHVALFIDWDNLAISTAADLGGASPDVRAIVHVAQRYGTILLARAYAEWQVPSDRLAVYRAGVDPIYAPTFRFESDPANQVPRGKSLADPCLVADCIDTLHLMPAVNHFVLVSGDKDLIPVVRLVQLRGRRVVVIGPDYVAAILREMADEYVSYRSIVELAEGAGVPTAVVAGAGGRRRRFAPQSRERVAAPAPSPLPSAQPAPPPRSARPATSAPQPRPVAPEPIAPIPGRAPPLEQPPVVEVEEPSENGAVVAAQKPAQVEATEYREPSPEELTSVLATVQQILHEREAQGKPRLRATNLKDLLMARISGFNERRYGFSKFKDLLAVAEKDGVLEVNRSGPVHWVTLPRRREESPPTAPDTETPATPIAPPPGPATTPPELEGNGDLMRFVVDLRSRSRWLTYTYVLTNLITHLSQRLSPQAAEAEARNALNRLVQEGVLRIDREPREIEVAGTRHRVRLCHLEESHPLVQAALAGEAARQSAEQLAAESPRSQAPESAPPDISTLPAEGPHTDGRLDRAQATEAPGTPAEPTGAEAVVPMQPTAEAGPVRQTEEQSFALPHLPESLQLPSAMAGLTFEAPWRAAAPTEVSAVSEEAPGPTPPESHADESSAAEDRVPAATVEEPVRTPTLAEAFAALREVVRRATGPGKPMAGAASAKTRLARSLGGFDERAYGFSKFKDFLLAAQREGYVRVDVVGPATRVAVLPEE